MKKVGKIQVMDKNKRESISKELQDLITFEKQIELNTIPPKSDIFFKNMVRTGFNVAIVGGVRTAKTTFLTAYQMYEDRELAGVVVESTPELYLSEKMSDAPIFEIVASCENLEQEIKRIFKSDTDYFIMGEARDSIDFKEILSLVNRGTRRTKFTANLTSGVDFCSLVSSKIKEKYNVDYNTTLRKSADNLHFIIEMTELQDKSKKRLNAIYEQRYDRVTQRVTIHQICEYDYEKDNWKWHYDGLGKDKEKIGIEENQNAYISMLDALKELAEDNPMGPKVYEPVYEGETR